MSNMSYCRFRNTLGDLRDCYDHIHDRLISGSHDSEHAAREQLVELCGKILEECGQTVGGTAAITDYDDEECEQ
jgi:hypothetical protein